MIKCCSTWVAKVTNGKHIGSPIDIEGVSIDTRSILEKQLFIPLISERNGHNFYKQAIEKGVVCFLWQDSEPLPSEVMGIAECTGCTFIVVKDTMKALWDLAHIYRQEHRGLVIAITGSQGKTTTKELVATVLGASFKVHKTVGNFNNELGVPLSLLAWPEDANIAVLELGMRHQGEIKALTELVKPDIAIITQIGDAHGGLLGGSLGILTAKLEILSGLKQGGVLFYDGETPMLKQRLLDLKKKNFNLAYSSVGLYNGDEYAKNVQHEPSGLVFQSFRLGSSFQLPLLGEHNVKNALFAIEVGRYLGLDDNDINIRLKMSKALAGRLSVINGINGSLLLDDTYNASMLSMQAALNALCSFCYTIKRDHLGAVLGDMAELDGDEVLLHHQLGILAAEKDLCCLFAVGHYAEVMVKAYLSVLPEACAMAFSNIEDALPFVLDYLTHRSLLLIKGSRFLTLDKLVKNLCSKGNSDERTKC